MTKMGRPFKEIDTELLRKVASIQCTWAEIESIVGASRRTLENKYAQLIEDARSQGKMSLRRKQVEIALGGNVQMLIWLGKQYLDQKDKIELEELRFKDKQEALERLDEARARLAEAIEADTFAKGKDKQKDVTPNEEMSRKSHEGNAKDHQA